MPCGGTSILRGAGAGALVSRMSIITGRGDAGETDLLFGRRVAKTSLRVEALGAIDELNAALGLARAAGLKAESEEIVDRVQQHLVALMGELAVLPEDAKRYAASSFEKLAADDVEWLAATARDFEKRGVKFKGWARPGVEHSVAKAGLDVARSVCRRAEREVLRLNDAEGHVSEPVRLFFNRLSDLLWILARTG